MVHCIHAHVLDQTYSMKDTLHTLQHCPDGQEENKQEHGNASKPGLHAMPFLFLATGTLTLT